jgi:glycine/D-amino acid oxidase-like deaminating enzyme
MEFEVLVVGGGLIGSAIALGLADAGVSSVAVVDPDLGGEWSSSELNAGGVRGTWSQELNLELSKRTIEYFGSRAEEVGYRPCGYLWLHRPETFPAAIRAREMQVSRGWPVEVLDVRAVRERVPFIDKTDDLAGALFGVRDGLVNPNLLKEHYRSQAARTGVRFLNGMFLCGVKEGGGSRHRASLFRFDPELGSTAKRELLEKGSPSGEAGERVEIHARVIVNAAGAWAPRVAGLLGYDCPSKPVRRQISLFHARDLDLSPYGMIIDPSGVYFHPEAIYGLAGFATPGESPGYRFDYDGEAFFEEQIWARLYERSTAFESLKHISGWAGLYEESPDHHAIIGRVERGLGEKGLVFEAHSFSGHGVMQSHAAGTALARLMVKGSYGDLDLTPLSGERFRSGSPVPGETWVI